MKLLNSNIYDIIIIGAGISGLYTAYKLLNKNKNLKILILEKNDKKHIGGRMGNVIFEGTSVVTGAGIGRKKKDILLQKLLNELNISFKEFLSTHIYSISIIKKCNLKQNFELLKNKYNKNKNKYKKMNFKKFAISILGSNEYKNFVTCSGYSDYENADIYDTLFHYGFDDNYNDYTGLSINWKLLIDTLIKKVNIEKIKTKYNVTKIVKSSTNNYFYITTENNKIFITKKVIIASTINTIKKLVPNNNIYDNIGVNTFSRIYAKFSKKSIPIMKKYCTKYTILNTKLQKIIPINPDKGIYMIGYNDNKNADYLNKIKNNKYKYFENLVKKSLNIKNNTLQIKKMLYIYWNIGTHYYKPLNKKKFKNREEFIKKAQNPEKNMYVVGEAISLNQGWTEGALSSCESILKRI